MNTFEITHFCGDVAFNDINNLELIFKSLKSMNQSPNKEKATARYQNIFLKFYNIQYENSNSSFLNDMCLSNLLNASNYHIEYNRCLPIFLPALAFLEISGSINKYIPEIMRHYEIFRRPYSKIVIKIMQYHDCSLSLKDYMILKRIKPYRFEEELKFILFYVFLNLNNLNIIYPSAKINDINLENIRISNALTHTRKGNNDHKSWDSKKTTFPLLINEREIKYLKLNQFEDEFDLVISICDFDLSTLKYMPAAHLNNWYMGFWGITTEQNHIYDPHTFLNAIFNNFGELTSNDRSSLTKIEIELLNFINSILGNYKGIGIFLDPKRNIVLDDTYKLHSNSIVEGRLSRFGDILNPHMLHQGMYALSFIQYFLRNTHMFPDTESLKSCLKVIFPNEHALILNIFKKTDEKTITNNDLLFLNKTTNDLEHLKSKWLLKSPYFENVYKLNNEIENISNIKDQKEFLFWPWIQDENKICKTSL
jgi:hypothetical protein